MKDIIHEPKKKYRKTILIIVGLLVAAFAIAFLLSFIVGSLLMHLTFIEIFTSQYPYIIAACIVLVLLALYLHLRTGATHKDLDKTNDLENARWETFSELKGYHEFTTAKYSELNKVGDGVLIQAEATKKDINVLLYKPNHALIVGTTGTGKTTGYIDQQIEILSKTKDKPTLVITDPKGELLAKHANQLQAQGYKITTLDLREPFRSQRWNPFTPIIKRVKLLREYENNITCEDGIYYANGQKFQTYDELKATCTIIQDELNERARDLIYTLCPVKDQNQPTWEEGARNLLYGFTLAMAEDAVAGKLPDDKLQLYNIYYNISNYAGDDCEELKEYLYGRSPHSNINSLVGTVLKAEDKTLSSYLSTVMQYMNTILADKAIMAMTSENDIDIENIDDEPNAIFVIFPDEKVHRHPFVTLFIVQMYKELIFKATENEKKGLGSCLKRNVYMLMDEFGNLPRFEGMQNIITVARSRGIFFTFVLQSYNQLTAVYGNDIGRTIKENCNVKIFIGTDDGDTRKEFSELMGNRKVFAQSFGSSTNDPNNVSGNATVMNQPLISASELERLNGNDKGNAIVSVRGYYGIRSHFTPSFNLKDFYFPNGDYIKADREIRPFDEQKAVFDITGRSEKMIYDEKALEVIDELIESDSENRIAEREDFLKSLDEEFDREMEELEDRLNTLGEMLSDEEMEQLRTAPLDEKPRLLRTLSQADKYAGANSTLTLKLIGAATYADEKLKKIYKIQAQAEEVDMA